LQLDKLLVWNDAILMVYHSPTIAVRVTFIVQFCPDFCAINMDAPLFICTKEEQKAAIRFLMG
jgi:hypothetical protein